MKYFFLALFLGFSVMALSQNKISGIITDSDKLPLAGVSIYAPAIQASTTSDANGFYSFSRIPSGKISFIFSYVGFTTLQRDFQVSEDGIQADIILQEDVHLMDEVIISTAFNKLQSQNVMKVEHESIKSLQQKGITTLIEGLTTIPGVSQISTGASIGKPVIRGLSSNRVLVYSQGVRLENQQFGDEHGLGLNDSGIESVEVIKGPASLLYGSDALGGVLYFIPEKFANANTIKADVDQKYYSNTEGTSTSVGVKGSTDKWKFLGRGSYSAHSDYEIPGGDKVTNTRYNELDLKGGIGYNTQSVSSIFRYNFNRLDLGMTEDGIAEQSNSKKTEFPRQAVDNHIMSLHNKIFFKNSSLDADFGYIMNFRQEFEDSPEAALDMHLRTFNYDLKYNFPKTTKIELIAGIQGMHQQNENFGEESLIPNATINDFGVFGTANYEWGKSAVQAGLRYDHRNLSSEANGISGEEGSFEALDLDFDSFNASLGYKTDLTKELLLRLNLASGFRAPNLAELTSNGVHEGTNRYEIGDSNLDKEQNFQVDLNLEYTSEHFEFFANAFYNYIDNYIYAAPSAAMIEDYVIFNYTQDNARLYGGEVGFHFHPHPLDWLHIETSFETVTAKKEGGDYLPLIPANTWSNTIRTEFGIKEWLSSGYARVNSTSTFAQTNTDLNETTSTAYTLINAGFGGKIKMANNSFDFSVSANNIFDKEYISHLSRLKVDEIPNIGRSIIVGLKFAI
ncbi:TonB-dependent receptor [Flavobacterium ardleyense]|uniref:TonB-dependent receptor n=1 Tax=Flavobacterium ardleyense TaxID=2038737 RepID=UPI00298D1645|nr:TonB-dependent receptor [Flavobacterium ardleyense]